MDFDGCRKDTDYLPTCSFPLSGLYDARNLLGDAVVTTVSALISLAVDWRALGGTVFGTPLLLTFGTSLLLTFGASLLLTVRRLISENIPTTHVSSAA